MKNKPVLTKTFPRESDNFHSFPRGSTQHTLHWEGHCTLPGLGALLTLSKFPSLMDTKWAGIFPKPETCRGTESTGRETPHTAFHPKPNHIKNGLTYR